VNILTKWGSRGHPQTPRVIPALNFGFSVTLKNGMLLVGAPLQHPQPNNVPYAEGEAYVYRTIDSEPISLNEARPK
jgi:hypothetical protein